MLFGNADVKDAVGELGGELRQPHRLQHGGRYRDDVGTFAGDLDDFVAEDLGPAKAGSHNWQAGFGVNLPTAWKRSATSCSAGVYPRPFCVTACTMTGPS